MGVSHRNLLVLLAMRHEEGDADAIEYTIHYANFQNYPKGTVKQFDEASLKAQLDTIAQSFTFLQ